MIEINLIPEDLRRQGTTPPKTLAILAGACVLASIATFACAWMFLGVRSAAQDRVEMAQGQLNGLNTRQKYAEALEKERAEFQKRSKTIQEIAGGRVVWTRKLDRLSAIVNQDLESGRHQVWFASLDCDAGATKAGGIKFKGFSAGNKVESVSNFHEDLKQDAVFVEGFEGFTHPNMKLSQLETDFDPPVKMEFDFESRFPAKTTGRKNARSKR